MDPNGTDHEVDGPTNKDEELLDTKSEVAGAYSDDVDELGDEEVEQLSVEDIEGDEEEDAASAS